MDAVAEFCAFYHEYHGISPQRARRQTKTLREFEASVDGDVVDAGADDLREFLAGLVEQGKAATTVGWHLNMIRPFFKWLWDRKIIDAERLMELRDVKPPRGAFKHGEPNPYDRKSIIRFWQEFDDAYPLRTGDHDDDYYLARWRRGTSPYARIMPYAKRLQLEAIVHLALDGGLRQGEIFRLELEDMAPAGEYVVVRSARKNPAAQEIKRAVPWMTNEMRCSVAGWLALRAELAPPHDRPWLSLHGETHARKPLRHRQFEMLLRNIGRGWEFHRMRHTMATEALRSGMDLEVVSRILGHARIDQTLAYAKLLNGDLVDAAARVQTGFGRAVGRGRAA